jgi:hypothetical protein
VHARRKGLLCAPHNHPEARRVPRYCGTGLTQRLRLGEARVPSKTSSVVFSLGLQLYRFWNNSPMMRSRPRTANPRDVAWSDGHAPTVDMVANAAPFDATRLRNLGGLASEEMTPMNDSSPLSSPSTGHSWSPWNKGKIIGPRPPLRPEHVWSIRAKLHVELMHAT